MRTSLLTLLFAIMCMHTVQAGVITQLKNEVQAKISDTTKQFRVFIVNDAFRTAKFVDSKAATASALASFAAAKAIYDDVSFGVDLNMTLSGVLNLATQPPALADTVNAANGTLDAARALKAFSAWAEEYKQFDAAMSTAHSVVLLSGLDLEYTGDSENNGLANTGAVCSSRLAASVVEARLDAKSIGTIMAHELAHGLGAPHDGTGSAASCPTSGNVMQAVSKGAIAGLQFSECSIEIMKKFMGGATCMDAIRGDKVGFCGDGVVQAALGEQCDPLAPVASGSSACCDPFTCQLYSSCGRPVAAGLSNGTVTSALDAASQSYTLVPQTNAQVNTVMFYSLGGMLPRRLTAPQMLTTQNAALFADVKDAAAPFDLKLTAYTYTMGVGVIGKTTTTLAFDPTHSNEKQKRTTIIIIAVVLVVVLLAAAGAAFYIRRRRRQQKKVSAEWRAVQEARRNIESSYSAASTIDLQLPSPALSGGRYNSVYSAGISGAPLPPPKVPLRSATATKSFLSSRPSYKSYMSETAGGSEMGDWRRSKPDAKAAANTNNVFDGDYRVW